MKAAVAMPESKYSYRPTKDVRSFSEIVTHLADISYTLCSNAKGAANPATPTTKVSKTVTVSERNLQSAALRLLPKHNKLVSPEVDYLRRVLGERATQQQIDEKVLLVRKLPWSEIVHD